MLNLEIISKTFYTFSDKGCRAGSEQLQSALSKPFILVMRSRSSIDFDMNSEMSPILVKILASAFLSIKFDSSMYIFSIF